MAENEKDTRIELNGYSLLEHYEKRTLDFLKKQIDNGSEPLFIDSKNRQIKPNKFHLEAVITLVAVPYEKKALFYPRFEDQDTLMEKFRELFENFPDLTICLLRHLRNLSKIFDSSEIKKGNPRAIDLIRFNLLTSHGTGITDNDLALRINKAYSENNIKPINARKVQQVRYGLVEERMHWLALRNKMTKYGYCDPAPTGLR